MCQYKETIPHLYFLPFLIKHAVFLFLFFLSFLSYSLCLPQARQLERKEKELESISCFYKDQLETLEKKVRTMFLSYKHAHHQKKIARTHLKIKHVNPKSFTSFKNGGVESKIVAL